MTPGEYEVTAYAEGYEPQSKLVEVSDSVHQEAPGTVIYNNFKQLLATFYVTIAVTITDTW